MSQTLRSSGRRSRVTMVARLTVLGAALFTMVAAARANGIAVTSTAGGGTAVDGNCTLWEAIAAAKSNEEVDLCAAGSPDVPDIVTLPAGTFAWDFAMAIVGNLGGPLVLRGAEGPLAALPTIVQIVPASPLRFLRLIDGADVTLENLHFQGGDVTGDPTNENGGTILVDQVAAVQLNLSNVRISASRAKLGGAIYFSTQGGGPGPRRLRILDSALASNVADFGLADGSPRGGGIFLELHDATEATIVGSELNDNLARTFAHDWDVYGAGLFADLRDQSAFVLRDSWIAGNRSESAASGTGHARNAGVTVVAADSSEVALSDLRFEANELDGQIAPEGASSLGMAASGSAVVAVDRVQVRFDRHLANCYGFVYQHLSTVPARLSNVVLLTDQINEALIEAYASEVVVTNWTVATLWDGFFRARCFSGGEVRVLNSLLTSFRASVDCPPFDPSTPFVPNPHFVDFTQGDLHVTAASPAIDAGVDAFASGLPFDADHGPRIVGAHVDLGAYEFGTLFGDGFEDGDTAVWSSASP